MCVIDIELNVTLEGSATVVSSTGRYRLIGTSTWTNFSINLTSPSTPNIIIHGIYELEVNVTDSTGATSLWATSTFEVTVECEVEIIITPPCQKWGLTNILTVGDVTFTYIDCATGAGGLGGFGITIPPRTTLDICGILGVDAMENNPNILFTPLGDCDL